MTREDYIVRAIEQAARAVGRIMVRLMHMKDAGEVEEILAETRKQLEQLLGRDPSLTDSFASGELLAILKPIVARDPARVGMMAVLLAAQAALYDRRDGEGAGDESRSKALALLLEVRAARGGFSFPEEQTAFDDLLAAVDPVDLPDESQERLLAFYETAGRYLDAEDLLFEMCAEERLRPRAAAWGRGFFNRLLTKSDDELARGGLPRDEVEQALADVEGIGG
jgi:hypothetical protein